MLQLKEIVKNYETGGQTVRALKGVSIQFRANEFVAVLGHSGCGKTTLLNIIGGLDQYTSGDLVINGVSTKRYKDRDWDAYRNHSVGFVFQNYNLIPHQSVLSNVELALTISGVPKAERRRRAAHALEQVGLGDQLHKKPNQLSGGQMQRVAIARALVNDPEILLADEPTGALDSETSIQVMDLLQEIAREKLVIMVTHNPELAERYANRIVRIQDGRLVSDSNPYTQPPVQTQERKRPKRVSMSVFTAMALSLNNLMTKKGRTFLTAFAGSIGIIGIALILSLSTGINTYIDDVQEETLSNYPITIEEESVDMTGLLTSLMSAAHPDGEETRAGDQVYSNTVMYDMFGAMSNTTSTQNDLKSFQAFLEEGGAMDDYASSIQYVYDVNMDVYTTDSADKVRTADFLDVVSEAMGGGMSSELLNSQYSMMSTMEVYQELLAGEDGALVGDMVREQYDLIYGSWPSAYDEVVLIVDQNNEISDVVLYTLGYEDIDELGDMVSAAVAGEAYEPEREIQESWSCEDLCRRTFKAILPVEYWQYNESDGSYTDMSETDTGLEWLYNSDSVGVTLRVVGIIRPNADAGMTASSYGGIGYTGALTRELIARVQDSGIMQAQLADPDTDIFSGLPFATGDEPEPTAAEMEQAVRDYAEELTAAERADLYVYLSSVPDAAYLDQAVAEAMEGMTREEIEAQMTAQYAQSMNMDLETVRSYLEEMDDETLMEYVESALRDSISEQYAAQAESQLSALSIDQLAMMLEGADFTETQYAAAYENVLPPTRSERTYEDNLETLGYVDLEHPSAINIYSTSFADKDQIAQVIADYNSAAAEEQQITYTDYVALLMSSITDIISGISYLLIAFVGISLVVSSVMIGIITYISVLERTREIGILRSIGASKGDISNVFNAETVLVGLCAGLIGIGVSLLLNIPITALLHSLTGLTSLNATLPVEGAVILVLISVLLTFIAGLIPSRLAAKKDPVEALRSE